MSVCYHAWRASVLESKIQFLARRAAAQDEREDVSRRNHMTYRNKKQINPDFLFWKYSWKKGYSWTFCKACHHLSDIPTNRNADNTSVRGSEFIKAEEGVCGLMKWVTHHRKTQQFAPLPLRLKTAALVWSLKPTCNILENYKSVNSSKALGVFQWL